MDDFVFFALVIAGFVAVQQTLYYLLIDRKRVFKLQERMRLMKRFGPVEQVDKTNQEMLFQTTVPGVLSGLPILFMFGFIESRFSHLIVTIPFKIPAIVRGFPPFGMRDYFGWLYIFTALIILFSILVGRIAWIVQKRVFSSQDL